MVGASDVEASGVLNVLSETDGQILRTVTEAANRTTNVCNPSIILGGVRRNIALAALELRM